MSAASTSFDVTVSFSGGLDVLFDGAKTVSVTVLATEEATAAAGGVPATRFHAVLSELVSTALVDKARSDMLVLADGSVRPGVLVLIDDTDWALEGEMDALVTGSTALALISTLHGG